MNFKKYPKIYTLGKEETEGILKGTCIIQEKIDGANISIWLDNGCIKCGSRNQELISGFNGFVDYVTNHNSIQEYFKEYPNNRLYGEWLVRHSIDYNAFYYKKIYLFDIEEDDKFLPQSKVKEIANKYNLEYPQIFGEFTNPKEEEITKFAGISNIGEKGEGIVIKNLNFINQFGDLAYAKIVTQEFKEDNRIALKNNNKFSEIYNEMYVVNRFCTLERVQKIMNKLQHIITIIDEPLGLKHTSRVVSACYHDMLTEEIWEISKKVKSIEFRKLQNLASKKFVQIYKDILANNTDRVI